MIKCILAYEAHDGTLHHSKEAAINVNTEIMEANLDKLVKRNLKLLPNPHAYTMNFLIDNRHYLSKLLGLEDVDPTPCKM